MDFDGGRSGTQEGSPVEVQPLTPPPPPPPPPAKAVRPNADTVTVEALASPLPSSSSPSPSPPLDTGVSTDDSKDKDFLMERCIRVASWVQKANRNIGTQRKNKRMQSIDLSFRPVSTTTTRDPQSIMLPSEPVAYSTPREMPNGGDTAEQFTNTEAYQNCTHTPRRFTVSLSAAAEITDAIASTQYMLYSLFAHRGMTPVLMSKASKNEFGGRLPKLSKLRACFTDESKVNGLLEHLEIVKTSAATSFKHAVENESPVNVALAAWTAGNAAALQLLVKWSRIRYGLSQTLATKGVYLSATSGGNFEKVSAKLKSSHNYLQDIKVGMMGSPTLDTAASVFDTALRRCFREFAELVTVTTDSVGSRDEGTSTNIPLLSAVRQTRRKIDRYMATGASCLGMLVPRNGAPIDEGVKYASNHQTASVASLLDRATTQGRKRSADPQLESTLAETILESATTAADIRNPTTAGREWAMHLTQLFAHAFLDSSASLLSCVFGIKDPFSPQGFQSLSLALTSTEGNEKTRKVTLNTSVLADRYLFAMGNMTVPFTISDPYDIVEERRVSYNTPILLLVKRSVDEVTKKTTTEIGIRDRMYVNDTGLLDGMKNEQYLSATSQVDSGGQAVVGGCVQVIRGPSNLHRDTQRTDQEQQRAGSSAVSAQEIATSLVADWFVNLGVLSSVGRTGVAIAAGVNRALTADSDRDGQRHRRCLNREARMRETRRTTALRRNANKSYALLTMLGHTVSNWGRTEHHDTLDSYWSSSAAVKLKAVQESSLRGRLVGLRGAMKNCDNRDLSREESSAQGSGDLEMIQKLVEAAYKPGHADLAAVTELVRRRSGGGGDANILTSGGSEGAGACTHFVRYVRSLPAEVRNVLNAGAFFKLINQFNFPLGQVSEKKKRKNARASHNFLSSLIEMTLQSVVNMSAPGSVVSGWNESLQVEPSRMRALDSLNKYRHSRDVILIPVNRVRGAVSSCRSSELVIPSSILTQIICDKITLDSICTSEGTNTHQNIAQLIATAVRGSKGRFSEEANFFTLLRYIWFTTAIVSITDTNIVDIINLFQPTLGSSIYSDYLSIYKTINKYGDGLSSFSAASIVERCYPSSSRKDDKASGKCSFGITGDEDLRKVLYQVVGALTAFTSARELGSQDPSNSKVIELGTTEEVGNIVTTIGPRGDTSIQNQQAIDFVGMMVDILKMHKNFRPAFQSLRRGTGLTNDELDNLTKPNLGAMTETLIAITGINKNSPIATVKEIVLDLNNQKQIVKTLKNDNRLRQTNMETMCSYDPSLNANQDFKAELAKVTMIVDSVNLESLKSKIIIPSHVTPNTVISLVNAFSPETNNLDLLLDNMEDLHVRLVASLSQEGVLSLSLGDIGNFVQKCLFCFLTVINSVKIPSDVMRAGISTLSELALCLISEASLVVSRNQGTFSVIPPSAFSMKDTFTPSRELYTKLTDEYINRVTDRLRRTTIDDNETLPPLTSSLCADEEENILKLKSAADEYNATLDKTSTNRSSSGIDLTASRLLSHLMNPVKVWSEKALCHFDVAVRPKFHPTLTTEDCLRLSCFYQGMNRLPSIANPQHWEDDLIGNQTVGRYALPGITNSTFNKALDTLITCPEDACDLITREIVAFSAKTVNELAGTSTRSDLDSILSRGSKAILPLAPSSFRRYGLDPGTEKSIRESILKMAEVKDPDGGTAFNINDTWNALSLIEPEGAIEGGRRHRPFPTSPPYHNLINQIEPGDEFLSEGDILRLQLKAIPEFKNNLLNATKSLNEMAVMVSVLSSDQNSQMAAKTIIKNITESSPVIEDIDYGRVSGIIASVASKGQYARFTKMVAEHRNWLIRKAPPQHFTKNGVIGLGINPPGATSNAIYDSLLQVRTERLKNVSPGDHFWMAVFNQCVCCHSASSANNGYRSHGGGGDLGANSLLEEPMSKKTPRLYSSRVNTYAAMTTYSGNLREANRIVEFVRQDKFDDRMRAIESFVKDAVNEAVSDSALHRLREAQNRYLHLSRASTNAAYGTATNFPCGGNAASSSSFPNKAYDTSNAIIGAFLREMSPMAYGSNENPGGREVDGDEGRIARAMALSSQLLATKEVVKVLRPSGLEYDTYRNLLALAGVGSHMDVAANSLCQMMKPSDIQLFLGGNMLQRGLFVTFLLNNILFSQVSPNLRSGDISPETRSILVKLVEFCNAIRDSFSQLRVKRFGKLEKRVMNPSGRDSVQIKTDLADFAYLSAVYTAYIKLGRETSLGEGDDDGGNHLKNFFGEGGGGFFDLVSAAQSFKLTNNPKIPIKRSSTLRDVLVAPSVIHKSFLTNYGEITATRKLVRMKNARTYNTKSGGNNLMICMAGGLLSDRVEDMDVESNIWSKGTKSGYGDDPLAKTRFEHNSRFRDSALCSYENDNVTGSESDDEDSDLDDSANNASGSDMSISSDSSSSSSCSDEEEGDWEDLGLMYDPLEQLDGMGTPFMKLYGCSGTSKKEETDYFGLFRNNRGVGIQRLFLDHGGELSDNDESADSDAEDEQLDRHTLADKRLRGRANKVVYGPGILSSSSSIDFNVLRNGSTLSLLTRGRRPKRARKCGDGGRSKLTEDTFTSSSDSEDEEEHDNDATNSKYYLESFKGPNRTHREQMAFVKRALRQFVSKNVTIVDGKVVSVASFMDQSSLQKFVTDYSKSSKKDRASIRKNLNIGKGDDTKLPGEYLEGKSRDPNLTRQSLIHSSAMSLRTLSKNLCVIHRTLSKNGASGTINGRVINDGVLMDSRLRAITETHDRLVGDLLSVSPALFSKDDSVGGEGDETERAVDRARRACMPGGALSSTSAGYLGVPLFNVARFMDKSDGSHDSAAMTIEDIKSITQKTHYEWLTIAAIALARSFGVTTYEALKSTLLTTSVLQNLQKSFESLICSRGPERVKVKSTLLDAIYNTRMSHTESIMGMFIPTVFMNHELPREETERKIVEARTLTTLRGVNSGQLSAEDVGGTSGLLAFLTSSAISGPRGERGGLSLYRMSITDTLAGRNTDESPGRLKGAVSLEPGGWSSSACTDEIFYRRSKELVRFCEDHKLLASNAVGPIARFVPNGFANQVGFSQSDDLSTHVDNDESFVRLTRYEQGDDKGGIAVALSSSGNLYGAIDTIASMAKKAVNAMEAIRALKKNVGGDLKEEEIVKEFIKNIRSRRSKSLRTGIGHNKYLTTFNNVPALSDAIVIKAREFKSSITTVISDISNTFGILSIASDRNTVVNVKAFHRMLETAAVLFNYSAHLRNLENRLYCECQKLEQFRSIKEEGLSEARSVVAAIAQTMTVLDSGSLINPDNKDERKSSAEWLKNDSLFDHIIKMELHNIKLAKKHISESLNGVNTLHLRLTGMISSTVRNPFTLMDHNASRHRSCVPEITRCGKYVKHPDTQMLVKVSDAVESTSSSDPPERRTLDCNGTLHKFYRESERNARALLLAAHSSYSAGSFGLSDIISISEKDKISLDNMVRKIRSAVSDTPQPSIFNPKCDNSGAPAAGGDPASNSVSLTGMALGGHNLPSSGKAGDNLLEMRKGSSKSVQLPLCKSIAYIPVVSENRQPHGRGAALKQLKDVKTLDSEEHACTLRQLAANESSNLATIINAHTRHKFGGYNQAALVSMLNANNLGNLKVLGLNLSNGVLNGLPVTKPLREKGNKHVSGLQSGLDEKMEMASEISPSVSAIAQLREYANRLTSVPVLKQTDEFKSLMNIEVQILKALDIYRQIISDSFIKSGNYPQIKDGTVSKLSQMQALKQTALESFVDLLKTAEKYTQGALSTFPYKATTAVGNPSSSSSATAIIDSSNSKASAPFFEAYVRLQEEYGGGEERGVRDAIEREMSIRVPMLLMFKDFSELLRRTISNFGKYYTAIDELKMKVLNDAHVEKKRAMEGAQDSINREKQNIDSALEKAINLYVQENESLRAQSNEIQNKITELANANRNTDETIQQITGRIDSGSFGDNPKDIIVMAYKQGKDAVVLETLRKFALANSGPAFEPSVSVDGTFSKTQNNESNRASRNFVNETADAIRKGEKETVVDFSDALNLFPEVIGVKNLTLQMAESRQRQRLKATELFNMILSDRLAKLQNRLTASEAERTELDSRRHKSNDILRCQYEEREKGIQNDVNIAVSTIHDSLLKDELAANLLVDIGSKLDRIMEKVTGNNNILPGSEAVDSTRNESKLDQREKARKVADSALEDITFVCSLSPLHEAVNRLAAMYERDSRGPIRSNGEVKHSADLQFMSIFDLCVSLIKDGGGVAASASISDSVLSSSSSSRSMENTPSAIVPGICERCCMMVFNLHTPCHVSRHDFCFDGARSRDTMKALLRAATHIENSEAESRHNLISMMEGNNGTIKDLRFNLKQKVLCMTPVNTSLGSFRPTVMPNTVLLPTSELFNCQGLHFDKVRSMALRSHDPHTADACKDSDSILECLAKTSPSAEALYFVSKDERRFFNSIPDCIIRNMSSEASSLLNTACDQNLVQVDEASGIPLFVGRRVVEEEPAIPADGGPSGGTGEGGLGGSRINEEGRETSCTNKLEMESIDMNTRYMVAPGCNLNKGKEQRFRMSRILDVNNARHNNTDVHVAGANMAWRIGEVVGAVVGGGSDCDSIFPYMRKSLLLGSVTALSAQKATLHSNDVTTMLNTSNTIQTLNTQWGAGLVSTISPSLATKLAYENKLFPGLCSSDHPKKNSDSSKLTSAQGLLLSRSSRFGEAADVCLSVMSGTMCDRTFLDGFSHRPLSSTYVDHIDHAVHSIQNRIAVPSVGGQNTVSNFLRVGGGGIGGEAANFGKESRSKILASNVAVDVMTDTVVDTLGALSASITGHRSCVGAAELSSPYDQGSLLKLRKAVSRVAADAAIYDGAAQGLSAFDALLSSTPSANICRGPNNNSSALTAALTNSTTSDSIVESAAERVFGVILEKSNAASRRFDLLAPHGARGGSMYPDETRRIYNDTLYTALRLSEEANETRLGDIDACLESGQLRSALSDLKKAMLETGHGANDGGRFDNDSSSALNLESVPLSSILSRRDFISGRLSTASLESSQRNVMNSVEEFSGFPLLVRHLVLDAFKSPVPLGKGLRELLNDPKAKTAQSILSESVPLLSEVLLNNTRDTPCERAVDRILLLPYLLKNAKRFDAIDPSFPTALTASTHCMLAGIDTRSYGVGSTLSKLKLHMTDTTSFFKNVERYERSMGLYGDSYQMSHRQNCNCPFSLHHNFEPSSDEYLVPSFAYTRSEVTKKEIQNRPYQCNNLLSDKHYFMAITKADARISGASTLRRCSEWTDMRMGVNYTGTFEPSARALSDCGTKSAGVNLDVIVRPNNARRVMSILECHRNHLCVTDVKVTASASLPSSFQRSAEQSEGNASMLLQNALPRDTYIQKNTMSAPCVIFANVVEQLISKLGEEIVNNLGKELVKGEHSVARSSIDNTLKMMETLSADSAAAAPTIGGEGARATVSSAAASSSASPLAMSNVRECLYRSLLQRSGVEHMSSPIMSDSMPFSSDASGIIDYDFLLSSSKMSSTQKEGNGQKKGIHQNGHNNNSYIKGLRHNLTRIFAAISQRVSDVEFSSILNTMEANLREEESRNSHRPPMTNTTKTVTGHDQYMETLKRESTQLLAFMRILKTNIVPALTSGILGEKMAIYLSLISGRSRLENLFKYGLTNSSSGDLSHLKPITPTPKHIEDTFMYRRVHPVLMMALPENFSALLQQEQSDPDRFIGSRKNTIDILNHPNTVHMARSARASIGAGGGSALGINISSLILHETMVTTVDPVVDKATNEQFHSPLIKAPVMVVNPFKHEASGLSGNLGLSPLLVTRKSNNGGEQGRLAKCAYLQVSMPTQFSGLVTNTGICQPEERPGEKFKFVRRDGSPIYLNKMMPSVMCSDARTNLLDVFSRAHLQMEDIGVKFGYAPEILTAVAVAKGVTVKEVIQEMSIRSSTTVNSTETQKSSIDKITGDVIIQGGTFPTVYQPPHPTTSVNWGGDNGKLQARLLPFFIASNPLSAATVNGVPLTTEGYLLALQKRKKWAGVVDNGFENGHLVGDAAMKAVSHRLSADVEPLREAWGQLLKLQGRFSRAASTLKKMIQDNEDKFNERKHSTSMVVNRLQENYDTIKESMKVIRDETAKLVVTSDLVTGGYAGDPTVALVSPFRNECFGIIGAISAPYRTGFSSLIGTRQSGIAAINSAIRDKVTLSSSEGRVMPEHNIVFGTGEHLLADSDSIANHIARHGGQCDGSCDWRTAAINRIFGDSVTRTEEQQNTLIGTGVRAANYLSDIITTSDLKKRAVSQFLLSNPVLLKAVASALYSSDGVGSVTPLPDFMGSFRGEPSAGNDVSQLNTMYSTRLVV